MTEAKSPNDSDETERRDRNRRAAGYAAAAGIGSAALVAALLYANRSKGSKLTPNTPTAPDVAPAPDGSFRGHQD